jgi:RNA polymerase sigma factor for flagellar operon FliA
MNRAERNKLVEENLPLVGYLVSDLCAKATHLSRDDFASVGAIALITSADSYDPSLGIPFGAYARRRITGSFADEMRANDWAPRSARRRIRETLAVQETLTAALGRNPSVDEIASALGVDRASADAALADVNRSVSSLDDSMAEFTIADTGISPEAELLAAERMQYLHAAVEALPGKMRHIIQQVYLEGRSVKEVAEELGFTHSAVSQQRAEAIRLLRDGLRTHYSEETGREVQTESRLSPARRSSYLQTLAANAANGMRGVLVPAV